MAQTITNETVSDLLVKTDCDVMNGGIVKKPVVSEDGVLSIKDGGRAESAIVSAGNAYKGLYIFDGGVAVNTTIHKGGTTYLYTGGKASGGTVSEGGTLYIYANAYAWDIVVQPGANLTIMDGAFVYNLKVNGGELYIQDGATVTYAPNVIDSIVVNEKTYGVRSGTTLTNATVEKEGTIVVYEGGRVETTNVNSCNAAQYKGMYVSSGGVAVNTNINKSGVVYVYNGGTLSGGTVSEGGYLYVNDKGIASDVVLQPGANMTIMTGASVYNLKVNGGELYIQDGATVTYAPNLIDSLVVNAKNYGVRSGTTLTNATVEKEGMIIVNEGGRVETTNVNSCNAAQYKGLYVSSGGVAVNTNINKSGVVYVYNGGTLSGGTVSEGGYLYVNDKGIASDVVVQPGANVTIMAGASVYNLKVNGGELYIQDGATVTYAPNIIDGLVVNTDTYGVRSGTTLTNATVEKEGTLIVYEGGVADTTLVNQCNADGYKGMYVSSGGKAINTDIKPGGALYVYGHGEALGGTVSEGAVCYIEENGFASDFRVQAGASLIVRAGGSAYNILEDGGVVTVLDGAVVTFAERIVNDTVLTDGHMTIHDGTTMVNTVIGQNGKLSINAGGRAENTTVNACVPDGGLVLYDKAVAVGNTMNNSGFTYIFSGGTAIDNTINSGGSMTILKGGVMKNVNVMSGGKLYMSAGSVLTGLIRIDTTSGYIFIDDYDCTIDFDVSEIDPSGDREVLLDDFERIRPEPKDAPQRPNYTITVDPDQAIGTYRIAAGRHSVDFPTITVKNTLGETLGTLSQNGKFTYNGAEYRLSHKSVIDYTYETALTTLFLHIGDDTNGNGPSQPIVSADIKTLTNSCVTVTADFGSNASNKLYSYDAQNWMAYTGGVSVSENCRVYFRGENSKGASGIACYTVKNIDSVAPTLPTGLAATVADRTVVLSWQPSSDEFSGMKDYVVTYSHDSTQYTVRTAETSFMIENADYATWQWSVQACDEVGNLSAASVGDSFEVVDPNPPPAPAYVAKGDRDGNGISDVMFVWEKSNCAHGYWMNGTADWWSYSVGVDPAWDNLGSYDMNMDGKADAVMVGNVVTESGKGAYIGFYNAGNDYDGWSNIGFLPNAENIDWHNKVGNLTGTAGANSIVWYAPDLYALGAWTDGTDTWVGISAGFGGPDWTLAGCGDFNGDGKDDILMMYGGCMFYSIDIDGNFASLGSSAWYNCEVRAIGDFSGDSKDDIVIFDKNSGGMYMLRDGNADNFDIIGQLDAFDWFVVGAGDYDDDQQDDLLVRQYSTGMLGYYASGIQDNWCTLGYGVDMQWTVIA